MAVPRAGSVRAGLPQGCEPDKSAPLFVYMKRKYLEAGKSSGCLNVQEVRKIATNTKERRGKELKVKSKLINMETTAKDIISKAKSFFFEKISKTDKPIVSWIEKK